MKIKKIIRDLLKSTESWDQDTSFTSFKCKINEIDFEGIDPASLHSLASDCCFRYCGGYETYTFSFVVNHRKNIFIAGIVSTSAN